MVIVRKLLVDLELKETQFTASIAAKMHLYEEVDPLQPHLMRVEMTQLLS